MPNYVNSLLDSRLPFELWDAVLLWEPLAQPDRSPAVLARRPARGQLALFVRRHSNNLSMPSIHT
jgi:hypothetical protein